MARCRRIGVSQRLFPVALEDRLVVGRLVHALQHLIELLELPPSIRPVKTKPTASPCIRGNCTATQVCDSQGIVSSPSANVNE